MANVELSRRLTEMKQVVLDLERALRRREAVVVLTDGVVGTDVGGSGGDPRPRRRSDEEGDERSTQKRSSQFRYSVSDSLL